MRQVRETELFNHVFRWLASDPSISRDPTREGKEVSLGEIGADVCCQGAQILCGKIGLLDELCCRETNVTILEDNGKTTAIISGTVIHDGHEQRVEMLVPLPQSDSSGSQTFAQNCCSKMLPSAADVLTLLMLIIPEHTWSGIKDPKVQEEVSRLTSTDNVPNLLQDEVTDFPVIFLVINVLSFPHFIY